MDKQTYTWTARSGVTVESCHPREACEDRWWDWPPTHLFLSYRKWYRAIRKAYQN